MPWKTRTPFLFTCPLFSPYFPGCFSGVWTLTPPSGVIEPCSLSPARGKVCELGWTAAQGPLHSPYPIPAPTPGTLVARGPRRWLTACSSDVCRQRSRAPHRTRWWRRCPGTAWACCLGRSSPGCARSTCARTSAARRGCGCGPSTRWDWGSGGERKGPAEGGGRARVLDSACPQPELPALLRAPPGFWPPRPPAGEEAERGAPATVRKGLRGLGAEAHLTPRPGSSSQAPPTRPEGWLWVAPGILYLPLRGLLASLPPSQRDLASGRLSADSGSWGPWMPV